MTPTEFSRLSGYVLGGGAAVFFFVRFLWSLFKPDGGAFGASDAMAEDMLKWRIDEKKAEVDAWIEAHKPVPVVLHAQVSGSDSAQQKAASIRALVENMHASNNKILDAASGFSSLADAAKEFGNVIGTLGGGGFVSAGWEPSGGYEWVSGGGGGGGGVVAGGNGGSGGGVVTGVTIPFGTGQAMAPMPIIASGQFVPGVMSFAATSMADIMGSGWKAANPRPSAIQRLPDPDHLERQPGQRAIDLGDDE